MFQKNVFNQSITLKKNLIRIFGLISYPRFNWQNKTDIQGSEQFLKVPGSNVLIISNHQTYFADVALMLHVIQSALKDRPDDIKKPGFIIKPKTNIYFIAAEETINKGWLPKIMAYTGAISIKRSWRKGGKPIKGKVDKKDTANIGLALDDGWVISFPQGTTTPFVPGRKGTGHIIKNYQPIVIPVVINGFRRAFDKKGLLTKKKGTTLSLHVKEPLQIDYKQDVDSILKEVMDAIEQSEQFNLVEK